MAYRSSALNSDLSGGRAWFFPFLILSEIQCRAVIVELDFMKPR